MKINMSEWTKSIIDAEKKKPMPILSFPAVQILGVTVKQMLHDCILQARCIMTVAEKTDSLAAFSPMDLSVEAEAFGCEIDFQDNEVPNVTNSIIHSMDDLKNTKVPDLSVGRLGGCLKAAETASSCISDRPLFAGIIGPFSLAGRLMDVSEIMYLCYDEPELVHGVMEMTTDYLIKCVSAYKDAGANGVMMAEPLTGIMSPALAEEFSAPYVKRIIDAVQSDSFAVIYHNCGNNTHLMTDAIYSQGAMGYSFGNAVSLRKLIEKAPDNVIVMGNIDPSVILNGTKGDVLSEGKRIVSECGTFKNFVLSSGCDIPPMSPWENILAIFEA